MAKPAARALWVFGFEEHLELNAVGVLEGQHRTVLALSDRRVTHTQLLEPCQPLIEAEPQVIQPSTPRIEEPNYATPW